MPTQAEKATTFRTLHQREGAFIIPNPWDAGSARILAGVGFEALATTSGGYAFTLGQLDGTITRDQSLTYAASIVAATDLPVSADLENGFGDEPEIAAETVRLAIATGLAGCSIEDATRRADEPVYSLEAATDRIRAAAEAAHAVDFPFTLTARAENYLYNRADLADTIKRLQAFQEAGADVLYAPGLRTKEEITSVISSVDRPVNVLLGIPGVSFSAAEVEALGAKRISIGASLARAAWGATLRAALEMKQQGTFHYAADAATSNELSKYFSK